MRIYFWGNKREHLCFQWFICETMLVGAGLKSSTSNFDKPPNKIRFAATSLVDRLEFGSQRAKQGEWDALVTIHCVTFLGVTITKGGPVFRSGREVPVGYGSYRLTQINYGMAAEAMLEGALVTPPASTLSTM
jgi:hypothetical protein